MTLRIPILLIVVFLVALVFGYCHPVPSHAADQPAPPQVVADLDRAWNLNGALDRAWTRECSRQLVGQPACRNHRVGGVWVGERGSFQMTRGAAEHPGVHCKYMRLGAGDFAYDAECAARYLRVWIDRCRDQVKGENAYKRGFCTSTPRKVVSR